MAKKQNLRCPARQIWLFGVESGSHAYFIVPEMDRICGSVGTFNHLTSSLPHCDSADPFNPVQTRDVVTDARVLSSIMTLTLWPALSYTAELYAENTFL